jgi:hypothetical protein
MTREEILNKVKKLREEIDNQEDVYHLLGLELECNNLLTQISPSEVGFEQAVGLRNYCTAKMELLGFTHITADDLC